MTNFSAAGKVRRPLSAILVQIFCKNPLYALLAFLFCGSNSWALGVSPYLPLNLSPQIERKIERVLVLGDKPIMRKPIAAALVLEALPKACKVDETLCE